MGGLYLMCWRRNYPQATGTYMDPLALSRALEWNNTLRTDAVIYPASW
jgi:hypothetical protein